MNRTRRWLAEQRDPYWKEQGAEWIALFEQLPDDSRALTVWEGDAGALASGWERSTHWHMMCRILEKLAELEP